MGLAPRISFHTDNTEGELCARPLDSEDTQRYIYWAGRDEGQNKEEVYLNGVGLLCLQAEEHHFRESLKM
jgi:hypothetical protein